MERKKRRKDEVRVPTTGEKEIIKERKNCIAC